MKKKMIFFSIFFGIILFSVGFFVYNSVESSGLRYSGGMIITSTSEKITEAKSKCESGQTCGGTCSKTWVDTSSIACSQGTFTLDVYSPKGASTDYCITSSKKGSKKKATSGKLLLSAYTSPQPTQIGTCTCLNGDPCAPTVVQVSAPLAQIVTYGTN